MLRQPVATLCPAGSLLGDLAQVALIDGKGEGAALAQVLAGDLGNMMIPVMVPADQVLCSIVDELRKRRHLDKVAQVEKLIAALKQGQHRIISGAFNLQLPSDPTSDQVLEALDKQRRAVIEAVERAAKRPGG